MRKRILIPLILILSMTGVAQRLVLKTYNRSSGLVSDYIMCMLQDREGFLWFGTDRGLCRYDGEQFITYTVKDGLPENFISNLFQDRDGYIWANTYGNGVARFDGNTFHVITEQDGILPKTVGPIDQDSSGTIYFTSLNGISMLDRGKITTDSTKLNVRLSLPTNDKVIIVRQGKKFYKINNSKSNSLIFHTLVFHPYEPFFNVINLDSSTAKRFKADYCVRTYNNIYFFSFVNDTDLTLTRSIDANSTYILPHQDSIIWAATYLNGILRITPESIDTIDTNDGLGLQRIETLMNDREGNLWISTFGNGVQKLSGTSVRLFKEEDGLPGNHAFTIFEDSKDRIWFGTTGGLSLLEHNTLTRILPKEKLLTEVRSIAEDRKGNYYIGTYERFFGPLSYEQLLHGHRAKSMRIGYGASSVFYDYRSKSDTPSVWVSTYGNGANLFHGKDSIVYRTENGMASDLIEKIVPTNNALWFLSHNSGATKLQGSRFESFTMKTGLPTNTIYSLYEEPQTANGPGDILIGTDEGVTKISSGKKIDFTAKDGIVGAPVLGIFPIQDPDIKSEHDYYIATPTALHILRDNRFELLMTFSFLSTERPGVNDVYLSEKTHTLWLATTNGIYRVNLTDIKKRTLAPCVCITGIIADTSAMFYRFAGTTPDSAIPSPSLSYRNNTLTINYAGLSYTSESDIHFLIRLDPIDDDWSSTADRHVQYRNLSDGDYTFRVTAININGIRSPAEATFSFHVLAPYWKQWWFLLLASISILSIIIGSVRFLSIRKFKKQLEQFQREQELQHERERISRDLHDNVGSQLVNIISGLELAGRYSGSQQEHLNELITSLQQDTRLTMGQLRETIWALQSSELTFERFSIELEQYIRKQLKYYPAVKLQFERTGNHLNPIRPIEGLTLIRIAQEAITNCLKHATPTVIQLSLELDQKQKCTLSIRNDGTLKKPALGNLSGGKGLLNMERRAKDLGGSFQFSQDESGNALIIATIRLQEHE